MRPSISVTLETGLERGVPWGRDLYTFVTSAAGHMMRTLQKPRKNRPSKRQVNHRRFLHNMIQRKFADIEAANHQQASALYFKDEENNLSSLRSQKPEADSPSRSVQLQDPEKRSSNTDADAISKSRTDIPIDPLQGSNEEKHADSQHHPKSKPTTCSTRKNNKSKGRKEKSRANHKVVEFPSISSPIGTDYYQETELHHTEYFNDESQLRSVSTLSEDAQTSLQNSNFIQSGPGMDVSPPFSPELSPLSLDSCDFSIQMFTDMSTCSQAQRTIADIAASPWTDIMDLFSADSKDLGGCMDVEAYFEGVCARQSEGGQEVSAADVLTFAEQPGCFTERMHRNTSEVDDLHCDIYGYGYSCHRDQGLSINHSAETQFDNFKPTQSPDIGQNQLPTSASCHYNTSHLQSYRGAEEVSACLGVNCEKILSFTPFEGIAQSFSAPLHHPEHRPIPTPPHEDDWLFTDILKDRKSHDCYGNMCFLQV